MEKGNTGLKVTLILFLFLVVALVAEASLIHVYSYYSGVECPNCGSTQTKIWATDEYQIEYECTNCGAIFFEDGFIIRYDEEINKIYSHNHTNKPINRTV